MRIRIITQTVTTKAVNTATKFVISNMTVPFKINY